MKLLQKLFGLGKPSQNEKILQNLHEQVVQAVRQPAFYLHYGVQDTFDARFEMLMLFMTLVLRRLNALPAPAPDVAQGLTDEMMRNFDIALRQEGIGDVAVPKRIKKYAQALAGRYSAYAAAFDAEGDDALMQSLSRNIGETVDSAALARYCRATQQAFAKSELVVFTDQRVPFPGAAEIL